MWFLKKEHDLKGFEIKHHGVNGNGSLLVQLRNKNKEKLSKLFNTTVEFEKTGVYVRILNITVPSRNGNYKTGIIKFNDKKVGNITLDNITDIKVYKVHYIYFDLNLIKYQNLKFNPIEILFGSKYKKIIFELTGYKFEELKELVIEYIV